MKTKLDLNIRNSIIKRIFFQLMGLVLIAAAIILHFTTMIVWAGSIWIHRLLFTSYIRSSKDPFDINTQDKKYWNEYSEKIANMYTEFGEYFDFETFYISEEENED